jgi:hypothetical protein
VSNVSLEHAPRSKLCSSPPHTQALDRSQYAKLAFVLWSALASRERCTPSNQRPAYVFRAGGCRRCGFPQMAYGTRSSTEAAHEK